jgi:hypothetical protein
MTSDLVHNVTDKLIAARVQHRAAETSLVLPRHLYLPPCMCGDTIVRLPRHYPARAGRTISGTTAVTSISTFAAASTSAFTSTALIAG